MSANEAFQADLEDQTRREKSSKKVEKIVKAERVHESDNSDAGLKSVFVEDSDQTAKILSKAEKDLKKLQIEERKNPKKLDSRLLQNINSYLKHDVLRKKSSEESQIESHKSDAASSSESESAISDSSNSEEENEIGKHRTEWQISIAKKKEAAIESLQNVFDEKNISGEFRNVYEQVYM